MVPGGGQGAVFHVTLPRLRFACGYNRAKLLGRGSIWIQRSQSRRSAFCLMTERPPSKASCGSPSARGAAAVSRRAASFRSSTAWWSMWAATTSSRASSWNRASWCAPPITSATARAWPAQTSLAACPLTARRRSSRTSTSCARPSPPATPAKPLTSCSAIPWEASSRAPTWRATARTWRRPSSAAWFCWAASSPSAVSARS